MSSAGVEGEEGYEEGKDVDDVDDEKSKSEEAKGTNVEEHGRLVGGVAAEATIDL